MSELKMIPLKEIQMIQNYRDVEPPSISDPDVIELAESISKHGVMQAVLLRPGKKKGYELIFGHRRFLASQVAKKDTIPAQVKEVADLDILELQVTENLQRKDVHPMDEALAFLSLQAAKSLSVQDLADRFAKKPEYIAQRLSFNKLIPELQKEFKKNGIQIGHAILLARLSEADQKQLKNDRDYGAEGFGTVRSLAEYIDRTITRNLKNAPFDLDDKTLNKSAGACTTCQKRSCNNILLFPDIDPAKDDRCFDQACFTLKADRAFSQKVMELAQTKPNILFLVKRHSVEPNKEILKELKSLGVGILEEDKHFESYSYGKFKKKVKGFYLNGHNRGEFGFVYIQGADEKNGKKSPDEIDPAEEIKKIQEREKRAKELDGEKVHIQILNQLKEHPQLEEPGLPWQPIDRGIMIFLLLDYAGYSARNKIEENLGILKSNYNKGYQLEYFQILANISDDDLAFIVRTIAQEKFGTVNFGTYSGIREQHTIQYIMADYLGIDLDSLFAAQKEIADKRISRVKKRIKDLKDTMEKPAASVDPEGSSKAKKSSKKSK
jgi:ParB/RepB/Spo0J family partition protein